ncbi:uncharacterized protein LOC134659595 isoform X4 [Cydia amplana]|uniref:uncharacterized protein LOC134659595 isoform X4 n=1 Tax=Cydia amplana TaxID=1869771 RepID=UPI002FE5D500
MSTEMEKLKKLRVIRSQCKGTITRIDSFVKDPVALAAASADILEARKEKLISTLKDYEKVQMDILSIDEGDGEQGCIKTENGPVFQNTMLGYVVGGSIPEQGTTCNIVTNLINISDGEKLENVMEQFWLSEKLPEVEKSTNDEFIQAEKIFQDSVSLKDNIFYVDMPLAFPMEELGLGDSFSVAYNRFIMLEKRLQKDPLLFEQYKKFIDLYLELGHAKIVDIEGYDLNGPVFFLGHHCVFNPSSRTSPHRVVFDGSMRSRNGTSLNQVMLNGPVVQSELFDILILFRTYPFILTCDIKKNVSQCFY